MPGYNPPPSALSDYYMVTHDHTLTIAAPGVLGNDSNPIGGTMTAGVVTSTSHGTLNLHADGSFTYTPNLKYVGNDSFTSTASNANGASTPVTDIIYVSDNTPTISNAPYVYDLHDHTYNAPAPGLRSTVSDADGDPFTVAITTQPTHGTLTYNADGSWSYTPNAHYVGNDSFQYTASDGIQTSAPATATIYVSNNAPGATDQSYSVYENQTLIVAMPGVRSGVSDLDSDPTTLSLVAGPSHGSLIADANGAAGLRQNGSFTYQPTTDYVGTDTFTFKANDGVVDSRIATVTITVVAPQVQRIDWIATSSPLTTNTGPGGGQAIFPDGVLSANGTVDNTDRSHVNYQATITPALPNILVYLEIIDVDDPSSNVQPVDNESVSFDNYGSYSPPTVYPVRTTAGGAGHGARLPGVDASRR